MPLGSQKGKHAVSTKRSISLLLTILFLMGCALMGCDAEEPMKTPTPAATAEESAEAPRALATSEQPLGEEGGGSFGWEDEYYRLKEKIEAEEREPEGDLHLVEEYMRWMETKARDRDAVEKLYEQVLDAWNADPENQALAEWKENFRLLYQFVQEAGEWTTVRGAQATMGLHEEHGTLDDWRWAIRRLQENGRKLYRKAQDTDFADEYVQGFARCLINFSIADVEAGRMDSLYSGRRVEIGTLDPEGSLVLPDGSFDAKCLKRTETTVLEKGWADAPADKGLEWVDQIREECDWWGFDFEKADATELMEEFYKDVMCKNPSDPGHKWYHELAEEYHLDKAIEHNEGFYATIYGKVEVQRGEEREPAPGASVRVYASKDDQEWATTANEDGEYEMERVLLHKDCGEFEISAEYKGDRVDDSYDGPLEEPDTAYEFEKDLLIAPKTWKGTVTIKRSVNWEDACEEVPTQLIDCHIVNETSVTLDFEVGYSRSEQGGDFYEDVVMASGTFVSSYDHTLKRRAYVNLRPEGNPTYLVTYNYRMDNCSGSWDMVVVVLEVYEETGRYILSIGANSDTRCPWTLFWSTLEPGVQDRTSNGENIPVLIFSFEGSFEGGNTISGSWNEPVDEVPVPNVIPQITYGENLMMDFGISPGTEWTWKLTRGKD
jgi:hypothetical protein